MAKVNGSKGLNFSGQFDVEEILKNQQKVIQGFKDMQKASSDAYKGSAGTDSENLKRANEALKNALAEAKLETQRLTNDLKELSKAYQQGKIDEQNYRTQTAKLKSEQQALANATKLTKDAQVLASGSYKEAQRQLTALGNTIKNTQNGFFGQTKELKAQITAYNELNNKLKAFDASMGNHQRNVGNYGSALANAKTQLLSLATSYISVTAALGVVNRIITTNKQISDSLADVQRTAGLTSIEADKLAESLKGIDTRTSLKGLLDISVVGGQLGIAKDQLAGFTQAVDELGVTLSGELKGGADGIAKSLGVLNTVFKVSVDNSGDIQKSYNQIGSAILGLGQSGLATGEFLADFGERVGGLSRQFGLSLPTVLSYGAVLQENGVSAEVAGTAFKRLTSALSTNSAGFFNVAKLADANLTLKEFQRIVNTDLKSALDLFFNGLRKGGSNTINFSKILKELKLTQSGVSQSIAALANNQEALNVHIEETNRQFEEGTLSSEQFAIKNDTLAASFEKLQNAIDNISTGPNSKFGKGLKYLVDTVTDAINGFDKLIKYSNVLYFTLFKLKDAFDFVKGGFGINDAQKSFQANLKENSIASGNIKASKLVNATNSDLELVKAIANAEDKLYKTRNKFKESEKELILRRGIIKETAGEERKLAELNAKEADKNYKKASLNLVEQKSLVESLKKSYDKLYPKNNIIDQNINGAVTGNKKGDKSAENERQRTLEQLKKYYTDTEEISMSAKDKELSNALQEYEKLKQSAIKSRLDLTTLEINYQKKRQSIIDNYAIQEETRLEQEALDAKTERLNESLKREQDLKNEYEKVFELSKTSTQKIEDLQKEHQKQLLTLGENASQENKDVLDKRFKDAVSAIALGDLQATNEWAKLFGNLDKLTITELDNLINTIGSKLPELQKKFNPVDLKLVLDSLKKAKDEIVNKNPFAAIGNSIKDLFNDTATNVDGTVLSISEKWFALGEATEKAFDFVDKTIQSTEFLSDAIGEVGRQSIKSLATVAKSGIGIAVALTSAATAAKATATTASAAIKAVEKASVILAIISAALQIAQAIADVLKSIFNASDKRIEKSITAHKDQVEKLKDAYNDLSRAVSNAVGESVYKANEEQIKNLKAQNAQLEEARDKELSKKKTDQKKVDEFNQQIKDNANEIIDINKKVAESLTQTNFKQLSSNFADALVDAFKTGADASKAFDKVFNQTIANAIKNSLQLKFLEPVINDFTNALGDFAKNNNNSVVGFDFDTYRKKIKDATDLFTQGLEGTKGFFEIDIVGKNLTGTTADSIASGLIQGFKEGKKTIEDFSDDFKNLLGNALSTAFQENILSPKVVEFQKMFQQLASDGIIDPNEEAKLKEFYAKILTESESFVDAYNKVIGRTETYLNAETLKSLQDEVFQLFQSGEANAKNLGDKLEEIIKRSILDGFKAEIFKDGLKSFNDKLVEIQKSGKTITKAQIEELKLLFGDFSEDALARLKIIEEATGYTFSNVAKELDSAYTSLEDNIINIFSTSENSAEDFAKSFEDLMKKAILNSFKATTLRDQLTGFYEEFKKLSTGADGLTEEKIAILRAQYNAIINNSRNSLIDLEKITGIDLKSKPAQSNLASSIGRTITEDTASELAGLWRGQFNESKIQTGIMNRNAAISNQILEVNINIEKNTRRTADNTERLGAMETALNRIANNTNIGLNQTRRDNGNQLPVTTI